jgi:hypothetical protein
MAGPSMALRRFTQASPNKEPTWRRRQSSYDLGENLRLALISVTEGEDKPLKYPTIFNSVDLAVVRKMDLAQAVEFDWHSGSPPRRPMEWKST